MQRKIRELEKTKTASTQDIARPETWLVLRNDLNSNMILLIGSNSMFL